MWSRAVRIALLLALSWSGAARAQPVQLPVPPLLATGAVRHYFDAFAKLDLPALAAATSGSAKQKTEALVETLRDEARRHGVKVELRLARLEVAPPSGPAGSPRVDASFNLDVVAKKSIFSVVARKLRGHASFEVSADAAQSDTSKVKIIGLQVHFD
jgi:hypothetical protein